MLLHRNYEYISWVLACKSVGAIELLSLTSFNLYAWMESNSSSLLSYHKQHASEL